MENGYGKRTKVDQFSTHARGGVGIKAGVVSDKTGKTVDVRAITSIDDDLVIVSTNGQVIRLALKGISLIGRATQGVRIMRLNDNDKVASIALVGEAKLEENITDQPTEEPEAVEGEVTEETDA
jgi:DNA gyrase subunit A